MSNSPTRASDSRSRSRPGRPSDLESASFTHHRDQSTDYLRPTASRGQSGQDTRPVPQFGGARREHDGLFSSNRPESPGLGRKVSLVRPERRRYDENDPQYHYRKHAQNMAVLPSTTGNDPQVDDDDNNDRESQSSDETNLKPGTRGRGDNGALIDEKAVGDGVPLDIGDRKLRRKLTRADTDAEKSKKKRAKAADDLNKPNLWLTYCHLVTFWCPNFILRLFGKTQKAQQRAWREKMGLVSLILAVATFVGYLTFGFTQTVCPDGGPVRLRNNRVGRGYMIFHGEAYDLTRSRHPLARGVPDGSNVLFDGETPGGGKDGSFMFQNVNGACKGLITAAPNSDIPTDSDGNLAWYFPCNLFDQDGSTTPNMSISYYLGYACHTSDRSRGDYYGLRSSGDVYFTWDDVKNTSRNLIVYNGDVLDLDLLEWINTSQVAVPARFNEIRTNNLIRGLDMTMAYQHGEDKQIAQCFQDILKVGFIDTETVGCIASKVVLYVALAFILAIVGSKFIVALVFQWFLCRKYAADRSAFSSTNDKDRNEEIENWTEDIYRPPPKLPEPSSVLSDSTIKRHSFLPSTSRFSSPYAMEKSHAKGRPQPTTMASQSSTGKLLTGNSMYGQSNRSEGTLAPFSESLARDDSRLSLMIGNEKRMASASHTGPPQGFVHDAVVPQPPPEWQPFGYPLAHTICLVTAYSEGPDGIRTTLDSIATTEYPNSHKLIFMVCDGMIKGKGETLTTPEACLSMMRDHTILPDEVVPHSYVAVASGSKRHGMAQIYSGFYDYGENSIIPKDKQQRVPMMVVVKCGTPDEANNAKPGNRGKRDSQIILMSFLQKVMFDERMTELEYEMFNGIYKITGMSPDYYEIVLMVDADTKIFPDSLTHMVSAMVKDPEIMGLCGETKIANKRQSWVSMIQVFEYFISHHLSKSFESAFGGVTCLPGCFCMYRIKTPKGGQNYWVPILANPDIVEHYSENVVQTLHEKNLLLLGEDRYLSTLMLRTFPKRKQVFVPQAVCKTTVPETFKVLLSQRRRWINSTVHNLMELVLVRDLCGTFCFSMQFVVFIELIGTLVLPAAISFTIYLVVRAIYEGATGGVVPVIPLILLALILGLPAVLIVLTAHRFSYVGWMGIYLLSLPIWNFVLPTYAYWKFDDFSWGDTRKTAGEKTKKAGLEYEGEFDSSKITMKKWADFEHERRMRGGGMNQGWSAGSSGHGPTGSAAGSAGGGYRASSLTGSIQDNTGGGGAGHLPFSTRQAQQPRTTSNLGFESTYDY